MTDNLPFLKELISAPGLSGYEDPATKLIAEKWQRTRQKSPTSSASPAAAGRTPGPSTSPAREIPSVSTSVPHRDSHTAFSVARLENWKNTFALLQTALTHIPSNLLASERK